MSLLHDLQCTQFNVYIYNTIGNLITLLNFKMEFQDYKHNLILH